MGLPSKKQLHKHKRGTRKALNTLDEMDKAVEDAKEEPEVADLVKEKKSKKPGDIKKKSSPKPAKEETEINSAKKIDSLKDETLAAGDVGEAKPLMTKKDTIKSQIAPNPIPVNQTMDEPKTAVKNIELGDMSDTRSVLPEDDQVVVNDPEVMDERENTRMSEHDDDEDFEDTQKDKYLTFRIGTESFGFSIRYITEIIVIHRITEVPDTPAFVRGVINLRGKVIPVIDVRQRFGLETRDYDERTCIIVVEYNETAVGLIVDTVNEVVDIPEDQIDPPPRTHSGIKASYILGMGKVGKQVNILLNLEKVLFVEEILKKRREKERAS